MCQSCFAANSILGYLESDFYDSHFSGGPIIIVQLREIAICQAFLRMAMGRTDESFNPRAWLGLMARER